MGMAIVEKKRIKPKYNGTVVCQSCEAEYPPGDWVRGYYKETGTARPEFITTSSVTVGHCPLCDMEAL